eukprot:548656_1
MYLLLVFALVYEVKPMQIFVRWDGHAPIAVDVEPLGSVGTIKHELMRIEYLPNPQKYDLIFQQRTLDDHELLSESGIAPETCLDVQFHAPDTTNLEHHGFNTSHIGLFS